MQKSSTALHDKGEECQFSLSKLSRRQTSLQQLLPLHLSKFLLDLWQKGASSQSWFNLVCCGKTAGTIAAVGVAELWPKLPLHIYISDISIHRHYFLVGTSAAFMASFYHHGEDVISYFWTGTTEGRNESLLVHAKNCEDLSLLVMAKHTASKWEGPYT